jgi:hypothetical protein
VREIRDGTIIPTLNLVWISSEYKTLDKARGPYIISFSEGRTAKIQVVNDEGVKKEISFKVEFPDRMHRLRISGGLGPHIYRDQSSKSEVLPSAMLYANYYLNDIHALKFFEALVMKESIFNHAGVYLGSELGKFYDDRLILSSLIGLQGLSYRHDVGVDNVFTQIIYPQGVEIAMLHPFGLPNYRVTLGGFFSPQRDVIYQNFWARFGSRVFVEFNYINWEYGERGASMYGLSVGFPLLRLF